MGQRHLTFCHDGRRWPRRVPVTQNTHHCQCDSVSLVAFVGALRRLAFASALIAVSLGILRPTNCLAAGGVLTVAVEDEDAGAATVTRMELYRADGKPQLVRRAAGAGLGVVVSDSLELALPDGPYQFRFIRGPEYRIITGNFTLERTSRDDKTVRLPRMVDMKREGWLSGDLAVPPNTTDLLLRMMAEDLHVAAVIAAEGPNTMPQAVPQNQKPFEPLWARPGVMASNDEGLLVYSLADPNRLSEIATSPGEVTSQWIDRLATAEPSSEAEAEQNSASMKLAIANPFDWSVPVWLASERIDGMFVLGDWLSQDKKVESIRDGRPPVAPGFDGPLGPGRYAESIYWKALEAGLRLVPLAGTGVTKGHAAKTHIGYNRVYAAANSAVNATLDADDSQGFDETTTPAATIENETQFWDSVWAGQSMITNGPMLRPTLGGYPPGHRFEATAGERLQLMMELKLSVRDPVEYLEIIHNGRVFYSARLDEFAAAGGQLPEMEIEESGWAVVRVVTQHESHYRMATSAPWFFEFDGKPRISRTAVNFFGQWLKDCEAELKKLPPNELAKHVAGVTRARKFWGERLMSATVE